MKSIILITFIIGLLFFTVGYTKTLNCTKCHTRKKSKLKTDKKDIDTPVKLNKLYSNIFNDPSVWSTYPLNTRNPH